MVMSCMETLIPKYVLEVKKNGKRKKGQPTKSWEDCIKKDLGQYGLRRGCVRSKKMVRAN